jgi:hypothetical protein
MPYRCHPNRRRYRGAPRAFRLRSHVVEQALDLLDYLGELADVDLLAGLESAHRQSGDLVAGEEDHVGLPDP